MKVRFSPQANARFDAINSWWRSNRDKAPERFDQEVAEAIELLATSPKIGQLYRVTGDVEIRRVLLKKTRQHLYYRVDSERQLVEVVTIWGTVRGQGPPL